MTSLKKNGDGLHSIDRSYNDLGGFLPIEIHRLFKVRPSTVNTVDEEQAAIYWYSKAADKKNSEACIRLGREKAPVIPGAKEHDLACQSNDDPEEYVRLLKEAASKGYLSAIEKLSAL
jgi:TPR repeat protein